MYQITLNNEILYDVRLKNRLVLSPVLDLEIGKNGTLSFIIPTTNDLYNKLQQKKSIIKVYQIDKIKNKYVKTELFRGTAYSEKTDFYKRKHIECEGELSFFNDTIVRPYSHIGGVDELFKQYVNNHNSQVNDEKKFKVRRCTVTDPNDYIIRGNINYPSTRDEINNKLVDILGGHFETGANEDGTRYVDYLSEYEKISRQKIEFGKNMLDITQYIKTEDVATRIIPLGAKDEDGNHLTIKDANNGLDYIQDDAAVSMFGVIEKIVIFEDVTIPSNLLTKGRTCLNNVIKKTISIELSAADLHNLDVNIDAFRIGDNVNVISKPHGLNRYFILSKLHLTLDSVSSCSMTLGATFKSFTQKQLENEKKIENKVADKVGNNEIIYRFNNSTETAQADVKRINFKGKEFNLTVDEMAILSENFNVDKKGNMKCKNADVEGKITANEGKIDKFTIKDGGLYAINDKGIESEHNEDGFKMWYTSVIAGIMIKYNLIDIHCDDSTLSTEILNSGITTPLLTQTSKVEDKKDFEKFENAIDEVLKTDIYMYHLKNQSDNDKKHIGFVIGDDYKYSDKITAIDKNGEQIGVDTYSMISVLWQAFKELILKLKEGGYYG